MSRLTIIDVLVSLAVIVLLSSLVMPALARGRSESGTAKSLANLQAINTALASYAADFDGRQPTAVVDDFSTYGSTGQSAAVHYGITHGLPHPPVMVGECDGTVWAYTMPPDGSQGNYVVCVPIELERFGPAGHFGFFRLTNAKIMQDYLGGRWFDPTFYAPNDAAAYSLSEPWFDLTGCEFPGHETGAKPLWASYCFSPAAMFDPQVLQSTAKGGYTNPYSYADGFRSPHVTQAKYPSLKTRVLEHAWNQNTPKNRCNPWFGGSGNYAGCEPRYFNNGYPSEPATLFFDGSTRLLPNAEVLDAEAQLIKQTGEGVWHRGTPLGVDGYYGETSYDGIRVNHHILTIDGIRGRDTLERSQ